MAFGMYFISSEFANSNAFRDASGGRGTQYLTDGGQDYLWEGLENLPANTSRRQQMDWQPNDRVLYSSYGTWNADLMGPRPAADDAISGRFLDFLTNKFREMNLFPDYEIVFDRWVSSNACAPSMSPNMAPLFRVMLWSPPESDTLVFPVEVAGITNQICSIFSGLSESKKASAFVLLDSIREKKGWSKMEIIACQNVRQVSGTRTVNTGRLIIGGQATDTPAGSILIPRGRSWHPVESGSFTHIEAEGRYEVGLGDSDFCLIVPKTIWLFPLLNRESAGSLLYCLQGLFCYLDGTYEAFNANYVSTREAGILVSWENAFESLGPRLLENLESQEQSASGRVRGLQVELETALREVTMFAMGLNALRQGVSGWIQKGRDEYTKMSRLANAEWVDFDGITLSVRTKHLHMLHPNSGKYHDLGVMHITFKPMVGALSLKVWNKTRTHTGYWNQCSHPHIEQGTAGCQGTLSSRLVALFGAGDYADGMEQILFFLGTVNIDDSAGRTIRNWPLSHGTINGVTFNQGVLE